MTPFDIKIPSDRVNLDKNPMEIESLLPEFSNYLIVVYSSLIDENLSRRQRLRRENYEGLLSKFFVDHRLPVFERSGKSVMENFSIRRAKNSYLIEIRSSHRVRGTKTSVLDMLRALEYGTRNLPADPIILPSKRNIDSNLMYYWNNFYESQVERSMIERRKKR